MVLPFEAVIGTLFAVIDGSSATSSNTYVSHHHLSLLLDQMPRIYFHLVLLILLNSCDNKQETRNIPPIPKDTTGISRRANNHYYESNFLEAKRIFDTLVSIDSANGEWYFKRAYSEALILGNHNNIINDLNNAMKYGYRKVDAMYNCGYIYQFIGNNDSARYYYSQVLRIEPDYEKAKKGMNEILKESRNAR